MITSAGLTNDLLNNRDISLLLSLSMQTQINEIDQDRHMKANLLEFIESVFRCAEKASFPPFIKVSLKIQY
jgi:hypothetical protein